MVSVLDRLLDGVRVVDGAGRGRDVPADGLGIDARKPGIDADIADPVLLALFDGDGDT